MTDLAAAAARARRLYRSQNFQGAYVKGARAAAAGRTEKACPYPREAKNTWGRAYRNAWLRGFRSVPIDR